VQDAAAWVTVTACPWIVTFAVRGSVAVFGATEMVAVPLPVPLQAVIVSQVALVVADHAQPLSAVTVTLIGPPAAATLCRVGETV
jgi:hypothetical protein